MIHIRHREGDPAVIGSTAGATGKRLPQDKAPMDCSGYGGERVVPVWTPSTPFPPLAVGAARLRRAGYLLLIRTDGHNQQWGVVGASLHGTVPALETPGGQTGLVHSVGSSDLSRIPRCATRLPPEFRTLPPRNKSMAGGYRSTGQPSMTNGGFPVKRAARWKPDGIRHGSQILSQPAGGSG